MGKSSEVFLIYNCRWAFWIWHFLSPFMLQTSRYSKKPQEGQIFDNPRS